MQLLTRTIGEQKTLTARQTYQLRPKQPSPCTLKNPRSYQCISPATFFCKLIRSDIKIAINKNQFNFVHPIHYITLEFSFAVMNVMDKALRIQENR